MFIKNTTSENFPLL